MIVKPDSLESRDTDAPEFILNRRPRAVTRQLPYIVQRDFLTPQSASLREACGVQTGELILCGGANSGKTLILAHKVYQMHTQVPGLITCVIRKHKEDLLSSFIPQWHRKVMPFGFGDARNPCHAYGGELKTSALYWRNGGVTFFMGVQDAGRFKGTEFDVIFVSQAEELTLSDWELLSHRADGRAGNRILGGMPVGLVIADCNPDVANHWIPARARDGTCVLINVNLRDNMVNFRDGDWTEQGLRADAELQRVLSGVLYRRLYLGEWCNAAGSVFPEFDERVHVIDTLPADLYTSLDWAWICGVDYGHNSPFVYLWCAHHKVTRELIVVKEWRYTGMQVRDNVQAVEHHSAGIDGWTVADHNPETMAQLRDAGLWVQPAKKRGKPYSLDLIRLRLKLGLLKVYRHALISEDPEISRRRMPRDLIAELHGLRYRETERQDAGNSRWDDLPPDGDDDAVDALCYIVREVSDGLYNYDVDKIGVDMETVGTDELLLGAVAHPDFLYNRDSVSGYAPLHKLRGWN